MSHQKYLLHSGQHGYIWLKLSSLEMMRDTPFFNGCKMVHRREILVDKR